MVISSPDDINIRGEQSSSSKDDSSSSSSPLPQPIITPQVDAITEPKRRRKKYKRKRPRRGSEVENYKLKQKRQQKYEELRKDIRAKDGKGAANLWDFESLFPDPVWDDETILKDLYEISERDSKTKSGSVKQKQGAGGLNVGSVTEKMLKQLQEKPSTLSKSSTKVDVSLTKELKSRGVIGKSKIKKAPRVGSNSTDAYSVASTTSTTKRK